MVASCPQNVQSYLYHKNAQQNTVLVASSLCINYIKDSAVMVISVGSCSRLPDFVINPDIIFVCRLMSTWMNVFEHMSAVAAICPHPWLPSCLNSIMFFPCHFPDLEANSLIHLNCTYYTEWCKCCNVIISHKFLTFSQDNLSKLSEGYCWELSLMEMILGSEL